MLKLFRKLYRRMSPNEMAIKELEDAQLQSLISYTSMEYSKAMVAYNESRINRLKAFIKFPPG